MKKGENNMSINIGQDTSIITVYKDEQGKYKMYLKGTETKENGEVEDIFMVKKVQFKKGVEVKNRSKIEVTKGWTSCYRIKTDELTEEGKPKYKYFDKYFISEFNLLEEGVDEPQKQRQQKQAKQEDFSFSLSDDDLPF